MNINALNNKNELLIKLLNQYIINFNFEIYQLFYLIIKKMEKSIEQMTVENLLETDEIRKGKSNKEKELLNENKKLKSKIKIYQQNKENIKSMEDENRKLNDEISKLKENFKKFKIENEKEAFKLNESIENLKIENEKEASKKDSEIKKLNESIKNLKIENEKETNKLNESIKNLKIENEKEANKKDDEINKLKESIKILKLENEKDIKNMKMENENFKKQLAALIEEKEEQKKLHEERYRKMQDINIEIILAETSYYQILDSYNEKITNLKKENQRLDYQNLELTMEKDKNETEIKRLNNLLLFYDLGPEAQKNLKEKLNCLKKNFEK